jgi:hypothetical protein
MQKLWKLIETLADTEAHATVNCLAIMVLLLGTLFSISVVLGAQPHHYSVQCQGTARTDTPITLVSRRTGLITIGPVPDAGGRAVIRSDGLFEDYEITLDGKPCVLDSR